MVRDVSVIGRMLTMFSEVSRDQDCHMVSRLPRDSGSRHKQPRQKQNWLDPPCWALEFHLMSPQLLVGLVDIARSRGVAFKTAA